MPEFIGVKKLHTDLKEIARRVEQGEEFVVAKHNKPIFTIKPYTKHKTGKGKYTLKDFRKIRFRGPKDASQRIDEIVYGDG